MVQLSSTMIQLVGIESMKQIIKDNKTEFAFKGEGHIYSTLGMWMRLRPIALSNLANSTTI
jgi:hypothetical protein